MRSPTYIVGSLLFFLAAACATSRPPLKSVVRQLRSPHPQARVRAMGQLSLYGPEAQKALPYLVENFRDRRETVNRAAEKAMVSLKEPGTQAFGSLLSDKDSWVRCRSAAALGQMPADAGSVVPALVEALHDKDFCVQEKAAMALGAVGDPAVSSLLEVLKSNSATARKGAALALGAMSPDVRLGEASFSLLLNEDAFVRGEAAMRITSMLGKIGIPVFLEALKESDVDLRQRAVDGLGEIGIPTPEVVDALIALFIDPEKTIRLKGAVVLGRLRSKGSVGLSRVAPNLASKDKDVLLGTLRALGGMGGIAEPSLPQMVYFLEESSRPRPSQRSLQIAYQNGHHRLPGRRRTLHEGPIRPTVRPVTTVIWQEGRCGGRCRFWRGRRCWGCRRGNGIWKSSGRRGGCLFL